MSADDLLRAAADELYSSAPDGFTARRGELAARARAAGEKAAARQIAALPRPTRSAWLVNQLSRTAPDAAGRLSGLGGELRQAQESLDGAAIRELSRRRRELLDDLTRQTFELAGLQQPPAALRDEVTGTLGAAMTDPEVAGQLRAGTLARAVRRAGLGDAGPDLAGFGVAPGQSGPAQSGSGQPGSGGAEPDQTVVSLPAARRRGPAGRQGAGQAGGRRATAGGTGSRAGSKSSTSSSQAGAGRPRSAKVTELATAREKAARERRARAVAEADRALAAADRAVRKTTRIERDQENAVRDLETEADDARRRLAEARQRLSEARQEAQRARTEQRRAQKVLDRAQR